MYTTRLHMTYDLHSESYLITVPKPHVYYKEWSEGWSTKIYILLVFSSVREIVEAILPQTVYLSHCVRCWKIGRKMFHPGKNRVFPDNF